jgi:hypothetical protein
LDLQIGFELLGLCPLNAFLCAESFGFNSHYGMASLEKDGQLRKEPSLELLRLR